MRVFLMWINTVSSLRSTSVFTQILLLLVHLVSIFCNNKPWWSFLNAVQSTMNVYSHMFQCQSYIFMLSSPQLCTMVQMSSTGLCIRRMWFWILHGMRFLCNWARFLCDLHTLPQCVNIRVMNISCKNLFNNLSELIKSKTILWIYKQGFR